LTERIDKKRLGIQESDTTLEGLIFKAENWDGPTTYESMIERHGGMVWGGWELKYPEYWGDAVWTPFQDYIDFAINSEDEDFIENISEYIHYRNTIDYYIFLNVTKAFDNYGKNLFMVRYDSESPYIILPWDLDATWGRTWKSELLDSEEILSNGLYERLIDLEPDNYKNNLINRWSYLRLQTISDTQIFAILEDMKKDIVNSGAYYRELERWPESELKINEEVEYIKNWTTDRLNYLDSYFSGL
jgi:spore coat protein CotH